MNQEAAINAVTLFVEEGDSDELRSIALDLMPEWLQLFADKNKDYGAGSSFELGIRGQYSDIHRKMIKLKRSMWEGEDLGFEDEDEIIMDLIGHLFLTLHMKKMARAVEREHAYSPMSTDDFLDALIDRHGGPQKALSMVAVLSTDLSNQLAARIGKRAAYAVETENLKVEAGDHIRVTGFPGVTGVKVDGEPFISKGEVRMTVHPVKDDSMAQWVYERFEGGRPGAVSWHSLTEGDKGYWRHEAEAVRRAHERGGFKLTLPEANFADPAFQTADAEQHGL